MTWAWHMEDDLTSTMKIVLMSLAFHTNPNDGRCFPSIGLIQTETRLSDRAVQIALRALDEKGYISIQTGTGRGNPSHYRLNMDLKIIARKGERASSIGPEKGERDSGKGESGSEKGERDSPEQLSNPKREQQRDFRQESAQASLLPTEPEPQAAKPTAATKKPKPATAPPDGFEAWWAAYPHKVDKQDAAVEYAKALAEGIKPAVLLAALKAYPFSDEKHFQIHPKRWLSKRRWEATTVAPLPPPGQPWIPPRAGTAATQFTGHPWPTRPPRPGMRWIWATASYRQAREDGWYEVSNDTH